MLYPVYTANGVRYTQCELMIMAWTDREGCLTSVFSDKSRVITGKKMWDEEGNDMEDTSRYVE